MRIATSPPRHAGHLTLTLPAAITGALLTRVPAAFHGGINEVLLTGLAVAIAQWGRGRRRGSGNAVLIDVEGHGREEIFPGVELSRTVGWFTSLYPVRLDPGPLDIEEAMAGGPALGRALKVIKEQLHAVPDHGLGYGLLRYLNRADGGDRCAGWRGRKLASTIWAALRLRRRRTGALRARRRCWALAAIRRCGIPLSSLEVNALTLDGRDGADAQRDLVMGAGADRRSRSARAGAGLVRRRWRRWCAMRRSPEAGGRTPSDLPLVSLSQAEIERLEAGMRGLRTSCRYRRCRKGFCFMRCMTAQGPDVYTTQLQLNLQGRLDEATLKSAVQALLQRHASLRAGFQHENLSRPVQIIVSSLELPWRSLDLSLLDAAEPQRALEEIVAQERAEHFDLATRRSFASR